MAPSRPSRPRRNPPPRPPPRPPATAAAAPNAPRAAVSSPPPGPLLLLPWRGRWRLAGSAAPRRNRAVILFRDLRASAQHGAKAAAGASWRPLAIDRLGGR